MRVLLVFILLAQLVELGVTCGEECFASKQCVGDPGVCTSCSRTSADVEKGRPGICICEPTGTYCCKDRKVGRCLTGTCLPLTSSSGQQQCACPVGVFVCGDPHLQGLRGQHIDVSGDNGGWYCLVKDEEIDLHVNIRLTSPLPIEFPHRQLITGLAIMSNEHSIVIEVKDPYSVVTHGCPGDVSPCLADGGVTITLDGQERNDLLRPAVDQPLAKDLWLSASNLPVECRQFGGDKLWAKMYAEILEGRRKLFMEPFEDWVLRFNDMAAPDWCAKYVSEGSLLHVQSNHALFRIETPAVTVRLNAGVNHQGDGEQDWDGRVLPDLEFWQMDVGFEGLSVDHTQLTGILGETARPVMDENGVEVMEGEMALRGTVEDYRVSDARGTDFALLHTRST